MNGIDKIEPYKEIERLVLDRLSLMIPNVKFVLVSKNQPVSEKDTESKEFFDEYFQEDGKKDEDEKRNPFYPKDILE